MTRPLLWAAVGASAALLLLLVLPFNAMLAVTALLLLALAVCFLLHRRETARAFIPAVLAAALACGYTLVLTAGQIWPAQSIAGKEAALSGVITEEPQMSGGKTVYILQTDSIELPGAPQKLKLQITDASVQRAEIYDRYSAHVRFYLSEGISKPGQYADGIYICGSAVSGQTIVPAQSRPFFYSIVRLRQHIRSLFQSYLSADAAAAMEGLILGDKTDMTEEDQANLRDSGISHIMAVSGLHLAVICQSLLFLLRKCRVGRRTAALITMAVTLLLMALTGFSASILRAGFTYLIMLTGALLFAKADALNSLGGAVLLILAVNPFMIGDLSFQLSVLATLGILLLCPPLYDGLTKRLPGRAALRPLKGAALILAQTLSASLFTLPVMLLRFDQMSLVSPLTNIAVSAAASAALLCGVLSILFLSVPFLHFLGYPLLLAAGLLIRYIRAAAAFFAGLPFATAPTVYPHLQIWLALALLLIALALLLPGGRRRLMRMTATASAFLLAVSCCAYTLFQHDVTHVTLLDTDSGLSVLLTRNGRTALVGAGGGKGDYYVIRNALQARGGDTVDLLLLPGMDASYTGSLKQLLREKSFGCLAAPSQTLQSSLRADGDSFTLLEPDQEIHMWNDLILRPVSTGEAAGLFMLIGETQVLLLPDGAEPILLPENCKQPQVLITGSTPPAGINAQLALVSADREKAGAAAAALALEGMPVYSTGGQGGLTLLTRGHGDLTVRREGV